mmetsp:Transcript_113920/g.368086  ORF Transcript_113920/g.368086 Transcript_113920/m.368086 type:complete len:200 (-) Transcript_113920:333-932(-)
MGLLRFRVGARTSVARPALKKTPKSLIEETVPSSFSPSWTSEAGRLADTSTRPFSTLSEQTLKPLTVSPSLYSEMSFSSWDVLHSASFVELMSMKRPNAGLILTILPSTSSPRRRSAIAFLPLPLEAACSASLPPGLASSFVATVTLSSFMLMIFTWTFSPSSYSAPFFSSMAFGASTSVVLPMSKKTPKLLTLTTVAS